MSLFDAMIRDFFGADPFIHMRPSGNSMNRGDPRPGPRNTGSLPAGGVPGPHAVRQITHMVEGVKGGNGNNGALTARTFRQQVTYSGGGSKSMNNIANIKEVPRSQSSQNGQNSSKNGQNTLKTVSSSSEKPISNKQITYQNSAPKPQNPDRGKRCSSVCEGWKRSLRNDKPERLLPAITKSEKVKADDSKMRPTMVGVPVDPNSGRPTRRGSERYSRHSTTAPSRKRSNSNCVTEADLNLNKSYPGAKNRGRKGTSTSPEDDHAVSSSSEDVSNLGSTLNSIGPYRADELEEQRLVNLLEKEMLTEHPNVPWNNIAGLQQAKSLLQEAVILPILMPDYFQGIRRPLKGVLMVGPPGTGKTMLAKAVATECKTSFFNVSSSSLTSKYRGDSEKMVKLLFSMARHYAPSVIFIDEVDSLCNQRGTDSEHEASRRFKSEMLMQMDGLIDGDEQENPKVVMVLAATNHPWDIDDAFRRRFEKRVLIGLPSLIARKNLLDLNLKNVSLDDSVDLEEIAKLLDAYSGADIMSFCRDAALMSMRKVIKDKSPEEIKLLSKNDLEKPVTMDDFNEALERTCRTVKPEDSAKHEQWIKLYGSH